MRLFMEAMSVLGSVLLQLAVGLLIEELTFAGLVRLILAPRSSTGKNKGRNHKNKGEMQ
ncbi:hypothetical protein [Acidicapsa acidisoli]|uniref:hypothetical protein n=1 Tax=Acidicapsa acidisoli TaxID=1615681 RepID=UPI0021E006C5|nr:hypothetical protein [Acidicapsa acidisoli]